MQDKAMCDDKHQAKLNRERVDNDYCGSWWREQERICAGWETGELVPKSLALGNLPIIQHPRTISKHLPRINSE